MAAKTWDQLHTKISTDEEFIKEIAYKGMTCLEIHSGWCGPSAAMVPTLKKLQYDMVEEKGAALNFVAANSDKIDALKAYQERAKPTFQFYRKGVKLMEMEGCNAQAIKSYIEDNSPLLADVNAE